MFCPRCKSEMAPGVPSCTSCGADLTLLKDELTQTIPTILQDLSPGDYFSGRYKIHRELGRGGMGIVYQARDTKLERWVALKLLPSGLIHLPEIRTRFLREAQAAARLDHPNICTVYESDEFEGRPYISMAYIEGQELKKTIERAPLESGRVLIIATQIAEGLEAAHKKRIVHRDIKSSNIMVMPNGQVKIMDFGIAKMSGTTLLTQAGTTMGTVAYMSPEQARGERLDYRTDLWSWGVVFYEMLSTQLPFPGETAQAVIYAILNEPPLPLPPAAGLSSELEKVVQKSLNKDIRYRYASVAQLLKDLSDLKTGIPIKAAEVSSKKNPNSVAVLDFINISQQPDCDWLSEGIAETVTVDLKRIAALQVLSRDKVVKALGSPTAKAIRQEDISKAGEELGIRYLVGGGYQKMGDSIRITTHLTEVDSGNQLGSAKVDGNMNDIFKLQDELVIRLTAFLSLEISDTEKAKIESPETLEVEAYEYYARGRQLIIQMGREGMAKAQEFFEKALKLDPEYAMAYSGLGGLLTLKFIALSRTEDLELGLQYLQKAIKYDPEMSDPYLWLAYGYAREHRFEDAIRSGKRAVELESDNPLAHYFLGVAYHVQAAEEFKREGYRKALDHYRINIRLAPNYEPALMNSAWIYLLHGQYKAAQKLLEQAVVLEESGKGEMVKFVGSLTLMGNLLLRQGRPHQAGEWYQRSLKILEKTDHVYSQAFLAMTYGGLARINTDDGEYDKALVNYRKAQTSIEKGRSGLGMGYILIIILMGMARACHSLGLTQESKQHYRAALKLLLEKKEYDFSWIWEGCDAQAHFEIASYHAHCNHPQEALEQLRKAIEYGWADWRAFYNDASFEAFRKDPENQTVIQTLKNAQPIPEQLLP